MKVIVIFLVILIVGLAVRKPLLLHLYLQLAIGRTKDALYGRGCIPHEKLYRQPVKIHGGADRIFPLGARLSDVRSCDSEYGNRRKEISEK